MGKKYFVVSDLHSYYTITKTCLEEKGWEDDNKEHILIVCGDAFDRGDETSKMFDFLLSLQKQNRLIYIKGNHDDLMLEMLFEIKYFGLSHLSSHHLSNGTFKSFLHLCGNTKDIPSIKLANKVEKKFRVLYNKMVDYYELGDYIFVHGWLPVKLEREYIPTVCSIITKHKMIEDWKSGDWESARWSNGFDCWQQGCVPKGKTVVCGHWDVSYAHEKFNNEPLDTYTIFYGDGIIGLDACTVITEKINVLVLDEGVIYG